MKKVSIIVPVYNVQEYLKDCINSIINQTYKNIEIILVDDGSTDNSGAICDYYKTIDDRIVVIHRENGGLSRARNTGLDNITGDYVMFIDSDDLFTLNAVEIMLNEIYIKNADYVIGNYQNLTEDGKLWDKPVFSEKYKNFKLSIKDHKNSFFIMNSSACNKIFDIKFINKLNLRFIPDMPAEDAIFTTYAFIKSSNVYYIDNVMYLYRQRSGTSISTNSNIDYFKGISKAYNIIYNNFKESNEMDFYKCFYAKSMNYILYKFIDSTKLTYDERIEVLSDMRWFYKLSVELNVPVCQDSLSYLVKKIVSGSYKDVIEVCKIIANIRKNLPKEINEAMSKPQPHEYDALFEKESV